MEQVLMGCSEQDITPAGSVQTVGFGRPDERSKGVRHPLSAQITIWHSGAGVCCLAAVDHIGFSKQHADFLRDAIGAQLSVPRGSIMLCFSHTHAAPNESVEKEYFKYVCSRVLRGVSDASVDMRPVRGAWENAYADIGVNRRPGNSALDRRIGILKICDAGSDRIRLILLRLTVHNNVLKADNYLISPDFFGTVRDMLQSAYGCPVVVTQGASGDVAPKYFMSDFVPPDANDNRFIRSDTALEDMAGLVCSAVAPVMASFPAGSLPFLSAYSRRITLRSDVPAYDRAFEIAGEAKRLCGIDGTGWLAEVRRLLHEGVHEQTEEVEVQYFRIGNGCLCGVANEVMCEFALRISDLLQNNFFYFGGYTNGCTGYFPTEEEFDRGGYEVYWSMLIYYMYHGRVFPLRRDSASRLIAFVVENFSGRQTDCTGWQPA